MTIATTQKNTTSIGVRSFIVQGSYPRGENYSETVHAVSAFEAMILVLAGRRHAEDGGDLSITAVLDASTGRAIDAVLLSSADDLLTEAEAIEQVLDQVSTVSPTAIRHAGVSASSLQAFAEYFGLVMSADCDAFCGLTRGGVDQPKDDMTLEYEDIQGAVHQFEPAVAMLALADAAYHDGAVAAALQVNMLATVARRAFNRAAVGVIDALCAA